MSGEDELPTVAEVPAADAAPERDAVAAAPPEESLTIGQMTVQVLQAQGFMAIEVPSLASAVVLSRPQGVDQHVVCLVDAQKDEQARLSLPPASLPETARTLRDRLAPGQPEAHLLLEFIEIRPIVLDSDQFRLSRLKLKKPGLAVRTHVVDAHTGLVGTTGAPSKNPTRQFLTRLLFEGPTPGGVLLPLETKVRGEPRGPFAWLTTAVAAVLAVGFLAEVRWAVEPVTGLGDPGVRTLVAMGGLMPSVMQHLSDGYRVWMPVLLHGDGVHLALNLASLVMAGVVLEPLIGRRHYLGIFMASTVGASLLSWVFAKPNVVSVGASGAVMGLLAAAFVVSMHLGDAQERSGVQVQLARVLMPSLLPFLGLGGGHGIDIASHVGGAIVGALWGAALLATWPQGSNRPGWKPLAGGVAVVGLVCLVGSVAQAARQYPEFAAEFELAPDGVIPSDTNQALTKLPELVAKYPHDPRVRNLEAITAEDRKDWAAAERILRETVADEAHLRQFKPAFTAFLTSSLAVVVAEQGRTEEARAVIRPFCAAAGQGEASGISVPVRDALCPKE